MNILVTGAAGFVGRNLVENLKTFQDGRNRTRPNLTIDEIYEYDIDSTPSQLDEYCAKTDFVVNLAGINRPKDVSEFNAGNFRFAGNLLDCLKKHGNVCPVVLSSSIQAALTGRFEKSEYGISKRDGEEMLFDYGSDTGADIFVYRFPNVAGKWVRPNYNSAVGTFCHNIANNLPIRVDDPSVELELLFIDDLLEELYDAMEGHAHRCEYPKRGEVIDGIVYDGLTPRPAKNGKYCYVPVTHKATLGKIVELLEQFRTQPMTLMMPAIPKGSLEYKLYSMYLSYLPAHKMCVDLMEAGDSRGTFTEVVKIENHGQFSVNVSLPGIAKGEHWHNTKWELFIVVAGHGIIQERKIGSDEILEFKVNGNKLQAVYILPGYTHNIINLSDSEPMVTLMWANEIFDPEKPDTYREVVKK